MPLVTRDPLFILLAGHGERLRPLCRFGFANFRKPRGNFCACIYTTSAAVTMQSPGFPDGWNWDDPVTTWQESAAPNTVTRAAPVKSKRTFYCGNRKNFQNTGEDYYRHRRVGNHDQCRKDTRLYGVKRTTDPALQPLAEEAMRAVREIDPRGVGIGPFFCGKDIHAKARGGRRLGSMAECKSKRQVRMYGLIEVGEAGHGVPKTNELPPDVRLSRTRRPRVLRPRKTAIVTAHGPASPAYAQPLPPPPPPPSSRLVMSPEEANAVANGDESDFFVPYDTLADILGNPYSPSGQALTSEEIINLADGHSGASARKTRKKTATCKIAPPVSPKKGKMDRNAVRKSVSRSTRSARKRSSTAKNVRR